MSSCRTTSPRSRRGVVVLLAVLGVVATSGGTAAATPATGWPSLTLQAHGHTLSIDGPVPELRWPHALPGSQRDLSLRLRNDTGGPVDLTVGTADVVDVPNGAGVGLSPALRLASQGSDWRTSLSGLMREGQRLLTVPAGHAATTRLSVELPADTGNRYQGSGVRFALRFVARFRPAAAGSVARTGSADITSRGVAIPVSAGGGSGASGLAFTGAAPLAAALAGLVLLVSGATLMRAVSRARRRAVSDAAQP